MTRMKFIINFALVVILILSFSAITNLARAQTVEPPVITRIDPDTKNLPDSETLDLGIKRIRYVQVETTALDNIAASLKTSPPIPVQAQFQVFDDLTFMATFSNEEETLQGGYLLRGYLDGNPQNTITLVSTTGRIAAILTVNGIQYQLNSNALGQYRFEEIDQNQFPPEAVNLSLPENQSEPTPLFDEPIVALDSGALIDIMVVYTDDARASAGGTTNMVNLINLAISETNTGYSHSGIIQRVRLVHTAEVSFDESGFDWSNVLNQLTNTDGVIDQVKTWRNTYAADLVVMIVNNTVYCGIGWLMNPSYTYDSVGFSLVSRTCATGYYSLAHETGHNMGAHHDRNTTSDPGMYSYSHGYQAPDNSFRTIMAYNCTIYCPRINYWSNPEIYYNGIPTGVVSTAVNSADNRLTLNNTANIVANFRQSSTIPIAPSNLRVTTVSTTSIGLSFTDNSVDESGFRLEKSTNGGSTWSLSATLSANQTTYLDQNLACGSNFAYRVKAYNSAGESAYSNTINTATSLCTPPALPDVISSISTIDSITINWNDVANETAYIIEQTLDDAKTWITLVILAQDSTTFQLTGLERNTTYIFRIASQNDIGTTYSDLITIKTMSEAIYLPSIRR